ncbi:Domain of uncharacterised function (DUF2825) [Salmonella enterica subsp. enterica]|uniref:Domain of uncharacterized function (DUF2825) n=1 Tax=Salmonella enterica I TaxID=59201 RepID=A0A379W4D0_SALET|nr:Domain of uncharacterised function (DUF2825) [Salmonella enterica subsp. enterica]
MTAPRQTAIAPVYPRWRGEHLWITLQILVTCGLSPLARGTQVVAVVDGVAVRFIPAGAGNTTISALKIIPRSVYPRWRGEHTIKTVTCITMTGLSPLARGTLSPERQMELLARFIPAGAGNTPATQCARSGITVYPRWRGEHHLFPH